MADGLDVIIVDDEPAVCEAILEIVKSFYLGSGLRLYGL